MNQRYTLSKEHMSLDGLDPEIQQVNPVCLDILHHRGFRTNAEIRDILFPSFHEAISPLGCKDITPALDLLRNAVLQGDPIVVYRDYDVDGITAGAVAVETLSYLGAKVFHYANQRNEDGYGLCRNGIDKILKQWPETKVLLTVDNGITANEAVSYAKEHGLTVIITDHHEPSSQLPDADAVIDLKREDEVYPYHDLCGCALIFRVMLDLYRLMKRDPTPVFQTLDMVALATVADVVPLVGQNRALVQEGIKSIETCQRPFFQAMAQLFNITEVTAHYTLAFQYAPTLNSLSRMGEDTGLAVEALLSKDQGRVNQLAADFQMINERRKRKTQEHLKIALDMIDPEQVGSAIILYHDSFDEGIVGILAGRLKEQFWRPVVVLAPAKDGILRGSCRSIEEFDLKSNLDACSSLLQNYGGHQKAAGLSLSKENLAAFTQKFTALADETLAGQDPRKEVPLAALLSEDSLNVKLVRDLRILEPYGEGFPEPIFGLVARPDSVRYMGAEQQHAKLLCSQNNLAIIAWNMASKVRLMSRLPGKFIGKPELNIWRGSVTVQFIQSSSN